MTSGIESPIQRLGRRGFLTSAASGTGLLALAHQLAEGASGRDPLEPKAAHGLSKAKACICIYLEGGPSQMDLFDPKPKLKALTGQPCPESLYKKERFAFIKGVPKMLGATHDFARYGRSGMELGTLIPHIGANADDLCLIRSMFTEQFNHAPAQLYLHTGAPRQGRPGLGSWLTYGLGCESQDLPAFVVLVSGKSPDGGASLWGSAFLPTVHQGVQCRSQGDPVLYVSNPPGMDDEIGRAHV